MSKPPLAGAAGAGALLPSESGGSQVVAASIRCRFRPQSLKESAARCIKTQPQSKRSGGSVSFVGADATELSFAFDSVYGEQSCQADVFEDVTHVVDAVLEGLNGTILAYGQTGSGKTHTLIGRIDDPVQEGIVPRAIKRLAAGIQSNTENGIEFKVNLSVVEIYNEKIRDLLDPESTNLHVKQDAGRGVYIEGATEIAVVDEEQLVIFMQLGLAQRSVSATLMNSESSRSHCIVTVRVEKVDQAGGSVREGKLCMVDLAGSERQSKTGAVGVTLSEGSQINKSLSCLANVIYALTDDKAKHVPYRDSKLTRVLQDSLGGSARTVLIICCSPSLENAAETLSTLRFGSRAKGISNCVRVNLQLSTDVLHRQLSAATAKVEQLEAQVAELLTLKSQQGCCPPGAQDSQPKAKSCGAALGLHEAPSGDLRGAPSWARGSDVQSQKMWSLLALDVVTICLVIAGHLAYLYLFRVV